MPDNLTRACAGCDAPIIRRANEHPSRWKARKYCSIRCSSLANGQKGAEASRLPDDEHKPIERNGYIMDWVAGRKQPQGSSLRNGRYVYRHRLVMERVLGRELEYNDVVHHINHDKHDNRSENLELMSRSAHMSLHMTPEARAHLSALALIRHATRAA